MLNVWTDVRVRTDVRVPFIGTTQMLHHTPIHTHTPRTPCACNFYTWLPAGLGSKPDSSKDSTFKLLL